MSPQNNLNRLFVGSLPYNMSEGQLLELFVPFGRVVSLAILLDFRGKSRGVGFVEFDNPESAREAKNRLHHTPLLNRTIIVDYAKPNPALTRQPNSDQPGPSRSSPSSPDTAKSLKYSTPRHNSKFGSKSPSIVKARSGFQHIRQSVYNSRNFHARVGAKFAKRQRKK
ncbi:MAG: hypothetical protein WC686_02475 [Candidatus Shapirobacteria bacterium]|jgi:RNA recognition motif-containing protein